VSEDYQEIKLELMDLMKLVASCNKDPDKTYALSQRMIEVVKRLTSSSKKVEGNVIEEILVLSSWVDKFLAHPENKNNFLQVQGICKQIYQEISSY